MLQIEKNVPMPERQSSYKKYPMKDLEIGDSFLVPMAAGKSAASVYAAVSKARKELHRNFKTARTEHGVRVWRIA